ncbi:MAG: glycosyltransferase family 2 protein, partial [Betaproteobacteria bacterium]|nr:glycosyltransferase family 2 protein [Betaproteobacteria bacterium]
MKLKTAWRQLPRLFAHTPRRPRIHLYTMGWNEERLLPFFFRHYDPWVDRYVIYDDNSTDATLEMLHAH